MLKFLSRLLKKSYINYYIDVPAFNNIISNVGIESYWKNVICYRCVNLIASSASHVPWILCKKKANTQERVNNHQILDLLKRPYPNKSGAEFFAELIANELLFGNSYILGINQSNGKGINEIHLLNSNYVEICTNSLGSQYYKYKNNHTYRIDPYTKQSLILHIKSYNPRDDVYGISCLKAAGTSIDLHNKALDWNNSLLSNGARPSGAFILKDANGFLTDEQFNRIKDQLEDRYSSSKNAGRPMILEGLDWKEMSISPRDMDFIESQNAAARLIALAFGVPPQLLGIKGDNTYSNMQEARLALWEETIIPLLDKLSDSLSNWFSYWFNESVIVDFDRDAISALSEKRQILWQKLKDADFMTINEKRNYVGLPPLLDIS